MGRIVVVGLKPKSGCANDLKKLLAGHVSLLREEGLATNREAIVMEAADGTVIEIFEWLSSAAIEDAHSNPRVQAMWADYAKVCDFVPAGSVAEFCQLFSEFTPLGEHY